MNRTVEITTRLVSVLAEEERLYLEMKSLLQEERESMVARDVEKIELAISRKEGLASEGKLLEECRSNVMNELASHLGLAESETTLSRLCSLLGAEGEALRGLHGRLVALVAAVRELLEANANFAGEALYRVQSTLRLLGRLLPSEPTYGRSQKQQNSKPHLRPGRIVQQAV